jgi:hypothetical protein
LAVRDALVAEIEPQAQRLGSPSGWIVHDRQHRGYVYAAFHADRVGHVAAEREMPPLGRWLGTVAAAAALLTAAVEATAGMGGTPALGYNNCNIQCCNATMPSASFVKGVADSFIKLGLKDAGYLYVNM